MSKNKSWNTICDPISVAHPTTFQVKQSEVLKTFLEAKAPTSGPEEDKFKANILGKLRTITQEWALELAEANGCKLLPKYAASQIHTFGSYRLGVSTVGSDIDCLCIAPSFVEREEFFCSLVEKLSREPEVADVLSVKATRVPVVKFYFGGVQIDLLFSRLAYPSLPKNIDLTSDAILQNLDSESMLSINGCRVADQTLKLVSNHETFRICLRAVKIWGKQRGVYNNMMGYLGGVHLSILVARVCQLYPNAAASHLLSRFFMLYSLWQWPNPVLLRQIKVGGPLAANVWNPPTGTGPCQTSSSSLMPILTPTYPSNNTTHNVSRSTLHFMKQEFQRGHRILSSANDESGGVEDQFDTLVQRLMEPSDFFERYKRFLKTTVRAETEDDLRKWSAYVESRLRFLVGNLEFVSGVEYAIPWYKSEIEKDVTVYFVALLLKMDSLKMDSTSDKKLDLTVPTNDWISYINGWQEKRPGCSVSVELLIQHSKNRKRKRSTAGPHPK
jgi:poly(A) polymerase